MLNEYNISKKKVKEVVRNIVILNRGDIVVKKINSIDYGGKVIGIGCVFALGIPTILLIINQVVTLKLISILAIGSAVIGGIILVGFFIHLAIELRQDKKIDAYYSRHKNIKLKISDTYYECSTCGNRKLKVNSKNCDICGCRFEDIKDKTPQEIVNENCYKE